MVTDQANGSSQETGKGMDRLVEAACLNPLGVDLGLRKLQQLPDSTCRCTGKVLKGSVHNLEIADTEE